MPKKIKGGKPKALFYDDKKSMAKNFSKLCPSDILLPAIFDSRQRIVVFGDIHGDLLLAIKMLTMSGVAKYDQHNDKIQWIGGTTCVVQVGDQVDRCRPIPGMPCSHPDTTQNDENSDIKIMEIFNSLARQANIVGGLVISLLGNHELMNAMGEMGYVSRKGFDGFKAYKDPEFPDKKFVDGIEARTYAFQPGHEYGKMMGCTRLPVVIIGTNMFVHAGIINALIDNKDIIDQSSLETVNITIRKWLLGSATNKEYVKKMITGIHSMFWSRVLGNIPPGTNLLDPVCMDNIKDVLHIFKIGSIIVGHTPQFIKGVGINHTCSSTVWRVDTGPSHAFDKFGNQKFRETQYVEIIDDKIFSICTITGCKRENKY